MSQISLEQRLIAARPDQVSSTLFVDRVMDKIEGAVIISSVVRKTDEQQHHRGGLFMNRLRTLPIGVLVALAIGAALLTGGVGYAVYKTLIQPLTVEQTGSDSEDGTNRTTFAVAGCPSYDGVSQDEITAVTSINGGVSNDEARNYVIARCEQNAITKYAHDMVAEKGTERYDSSVLSTWQPVTMPAKDAKGMDLDVGVRNFTDDTEFYKDGKRVDRSAIPEGSLVHVAYGGVPSKSSPDIFAVMIATVDAKYYDDYGSGVYQRVPCHNNPSESCFADIPGFTFYTANTTDTGPVPAGEEKYTAAIVNDTYTQFGGVVTYIDGSAFTFRTTTGRSVTFHLPPNELNKERPREHALPLVGTEIIVTTIGTDRDNISSTDLLSAYIPDTGN